MAERLFSIKEGLRPPKRRSKGASVSRAARQRIIEAWGGRCWICGSKPADLTLDHVIPRRYGGPNTEDNLRPACGRCNRQRDRALRKLPRRKRFKQIAAEQRESSAGLNPAPSAALTPDSKGRD